MARVGSPAPAIVLYPFALVPGIFLYHDRRTRRDGPDLDLDTVPPAYA